MIVRHRLKTPFRVETLRSVQRSTMVYEVKVAAAIVHCAVDAEEASVRKQHVAEWPVIPTGREHD